MLTLSAEAAIRATASLPNAAYLFGSVYGYFIVAQSIMGLEAQQQLAELGKTPDVVVGSCGGGANLLGIAAPFIARAVRAEWNGKILSAESENCPILSQGTWGWWAIDDGGFYPALQTYGLPGLLDTEYIGGLGSTVVASGAAHFHKEGLIEARVVTATLAREAAHLFEATEGIRVALETAYQLAAVIQEARHSKRRILLVNISAGENDTLFYSKKISPSLSHDFQLKQ